MPLPTGMVGAFNLLAAGAAPLRERLRQLVRAAVRLEAHVRSHRPECALRPLDRDRRFRGRGLGLAPRGEGLLERGPAGRAARGFRALPACGFVRGHRDRSLAAVDLDAAHAQGL
jgi:hypothetical protein